jgi:membrane protein
MTMRLTFDAQVLKDTLAQFNEDKVPRLAAALSYTTIFAIAPLFIVVIAIVGGTLAVTSGTGHGHTAVENSLIASVQHAAGPQAAQTVRDLVSASFAHRGQSIVAQIVGWIMLIVGAGGLFAALQDALNTIWHVQPPPKNIWAAIRDRLASFGMLLAIGFVLLVSTALNAAISVVSAHFVALLPFAGAAIVFTLVNWIVSIAVIALLFALMYKFLPDAEIAWRDVWTGAFFTAVLFVVGQSLIALYLGRAGTASAYGAAGSLLIVLLWLYYSSMILLVGAEFTRAYAQRHGSKIASIAPASAVATGGAGASAAPSAA